MQVENETHIVVLPEQVTVQNITSLYEQVRHHKSGSVLTLDFSKVQECDTAALALVNQLQRKQVSLTLTGVSATLQQRFSMFPLLSLSSESSRSGPIQRFREHIEGTGSQMLENLQQVKNFLVLLADEIVYTWQYLLNRRGVYPGELLHQIYQMGYKSFPIVALISFLVGITISITSAQQLHNFGADIYLADLVGYGMIRELVPLMTGIILAGKIGAAITAEIASMKVLEETDALKTMGIVPEKFLMVPRLVAITLVIPLLVALADFIGVFAGVLVARLSLDIPPAMFITEMFTVVDVGDFFIGLIKTSVFGWLVVVSSGYKGFSVKYGATAVGIATTQSVVLSISLIIVFDCFFALLLY